MVTAPYLNPGERRAKVHVGDDAMLKSQPLTEETPEERAARFQRNWEELKKARILALKRGEPESVAVLDEELARGRGTDFPADAQIEGQAPVLTGRRTQQAAVRKSEPPMALIEQEAAERAWDAAGRAFDKSGTPLKPGQTRAQAVSEVSGLRDPAETRSGVEAQHAVDTGELQYGESVPYNVAKPAAAIGGFALGGPLGATAAEAAVRATAIGYNLNAALDKGMDPDKAADIFVNEMAKGIGVDALFNIGLPVVGHVLMKIPGLKRIGDKIHAALQKRLPGPAPLPELREARVEKLKEMTPDPQRKEAIGELSARVEGDYIPTRGQVQGKTGFWERRTYESFPGQFQEQEAALAKGVETMRGELLSPAGQPSAKALGERVVGIVEATVKATKDRLRPVFEEANELGFYVNFTPVAEIAKKALAKDQAVKGGGKLSAEEVSYLQKLIKDTSTRPGSTAEATLDFISQQKANLRTLNKDGVPTDYFTTIAGDLAREADKLYDIGARRIGKGAIIAKLQQARQEYRNVMESAYDGAIKQALKKGDNAPEDVGKLLWSQGKVTRIEQLDDMLGLSLKEGVASTAEASKLRRDVTRGFLQHAVQNVDQAANWSKSLANPDRKATWDALTSGPDGQALKHAMEVLEHAAQIAVVPPANKSSKIFGVPLARAVGGGLGVSWVTSAFNPVLFGVGMTLAGAVKLLSTAYVHGDKGTINLITKVIRSNSTATAASAKALQELLPRLKEAADKYGVNPFYREDESSQTESEPTELQRAQGAR